MTIKMKLVSLISAFMLVFAIVMVSVLAATGKSITMNGNVQFVVNDRSLFVKEVRMQETGGISDTITFTPGYINGDFNFNVGDIVNNRGSFTIYFDIINTTTNLHFVSVDYSGLSSIAGLEISVSPEVPASEETITTITADTPKTTTLELKVVNPNLATIDLSQIIITFVEDRKYSITLQGVDYYILGEDTEAIAINGEETIIEVPSFTNLCIIYNTLSNSIPTSALNLIDWENTNDAVLLYDGSGVEFGGGDIDIYKNEEIIASSREFSHGNSTYSFVYYIMSVTDNCTMSFVASEF